MISITPQGQVYLCKTPLENDYNHQLTFANATSQQTYFANTVFKTDSDYTYVKKDSTITVNYNIDEIIECNYLFYKNTGFTTKWYYCFITNMEYVNENATRIFIETDVFQTYQFNIVKKNCFVEREHVNDDTIGKHTVPEKLDTGEFIINEVVTFDEYANDYLVVAGVSKLPKEIYENILSTGVASKVYNGTYSGLFYIAFKTNDDASKFLMIMDSQGISDSVYDLFIVPKSIVTIYNNQWEAKEMEGVVNVGTWSYPVDLTVYYKIIPSSQTESTIKSEETVSINSTLNGYTPKNNKMFTGEFNYMYVTNNAGQDVKYNYEDFYNNVVKFNVKGAICPGCSIRLIPKNYKKYEQDASQDDVCNPYGISGGKYPICSWSSDSYTNWLTQQSVNIRTDQLTTAVTTVGLGVMGNPAAAFGLLGMVKDQMSLDQQREFAPVQAKGNINSGDVTWAMGWNQFVLFKMSVRYEFAKRIDDYLSAYGYCVNEFKLPNLTGRTNWNYIKTIGCNFEGDIPQQYLNKIKEIFNKGITLWHNPSTMLDYSQSNTIVS